MKNSTNKKQFEQEFKCLNDITLDFIHTLRAISLYSTRAGDIYPNFLTIRLLDYTIESAIGIYSLVQNGIHNMAKRELRYLIEKSTKYVIIDNKQMNLTLDEKISYLKDNIPNSSIDIISEYITPFEEPFAKEFRDDVKDFFRKQCAYVHPSKKQIEEQLKNCLNGNTIGFESIKMLIDLNKLIFRAYDMILVMIFHSFGDSMSGDIFIQLLDDNDKWRFHKGKYTKEYSKKFDYKFERQKKETK